MADFCKNGLYEKIAQVLKTHIYSENVDVFSFYYAMISAYDSPKSNSLFSEVRALSEVVNFQKFLDIKEEQPFNIGIDLPIYFGDPSSKHKIMIVAMDPKRIGQEPGVYTLGSVFSLHTNEGRSTHKNDYWKFIEPMISDNFVYLTDIYKLYYESFSEVNGRKTHIVSNKDKSFIGKDTIPFKINKQILDAEIKIVQPTKIIALGKEAANALKLIKGIKNSESEICFNQEGIEYIFMPHIARTVTQNISTVANLFVAMGKIKNDKQMENIGIQIKKYKGDLFR
jgi:uracil-DNA glycosylase